MEEWRREWARRLPVTRPSTRGEGEGAMKMERTGALGLTRDRRAEGREKGAQDGGKGGLHGCHGRGKELEVRRNIAQLTFAFLRGMWTGSEIKNAG